MEKIEQGDVAIKRYPFQFTTLMKVLFFLGLLLAAAGFGLTLWRFMVFLKEDAGSFYSWLQYIILFFVSLFLIALIISMLIRSQYLLTGTHLILQFGFIKQKFAIKDFYSVHLFKGMNKLAVYFDDFKTKYIMIVIREKWYDDFIQTLMERKPGIGVSYSTKEEEDEIKKKK